MHVQRHHVWVKFGKQFYFRVLKSPSWEVEYSPIIQISNKLILNVLLFPVTVSLFACCHYFSIMCAEYWQCLVEKGKSCNNFVWDRYRLLRIGRNFGPQVYRSYILLCFKSLIFRTSLSKLNFQLLICKKFVDLKLVHPQAYSAPCPRPPLVPEWQH